jgi:hypothetical protein
MAQTGDRIPSNFDPARVVALPHHLPVWANPLNDRGPVPAQTAMENLTMVLARSPEQESTFREVLREQRDPSSATYHHWLTPAELGQKYGVSPKDIAAITNWLESQGLHVNWVAPNRMFINFSGSAANVESAFRTQVHYYQVNGIRRMSALSAPLVPEAISPVVKSVRGLFSVQDEPMHTTHVRPLSAPQYTGSDSSHFVTPGDFATIYNLPTTYTGNGMIIGIIGRSRTDMTDFNSFKSLTGSNFADPTEVIPTAYGGVDPGAAFTAAPSCESTCSEATLDQLDDQAEATLDVERAGSVAPGAKLLLVTSGATDTNGDGIGADAQYLVETTPLPAQIMTISFGACESAAGQSGVDYWDTLFQAAAAEGISVFVSSGDSGASGCDVHGEAPPPSPESNSSNYICSSSYATCVGGTEFNDGANPSAYWNASNGAGFTSALSYIPEGGWNEPEDSSGATQVAASGGGVSQYIATPSWQTGTGVPAARAGRYTPDVSFTAAGHDGYLGCFAAGGSDCVNIISIFSGTSASAPDMAGVAALLDQKQGAAQGNLNPELYSLASSAPAAFHDVTVASSGVGTCDVNTPSMCNNSIPSPSGLTGGQAGFAVGTGYDEVTGLGSLNVANFLTSYQAYGTSSKPSITSPTPGSTLSGSSVTFQWTPWSGVSQYRLRVGTTGVGSSDVSTVTTSGTSALVSNIPMTGGTLYVRLQYLVNASWYQVDYTYTESGAAAKPTMTSPTPGSTLGGSTVTFQWTAGTGVSEYRLRVGTTGVGSSDVYVGTSPNTSATVTGIPANGLTLYVRLQYLVGVSWYQSDYTYTQAGIAKPSMTSPTAGSTLSGSTVTFQWTPGTGASQYRLRVGTTGMGSSDVYLGTSPNLSATVTNIPTTGSTLYVRLQYLVGTAWYQVDFTYTQAGTVTPPLMTSPMPGSILSSSSVTFQWNPGAGSTLFRLLAGTAGPGSSDVYLGTTSGTSATVTVPTTGATLYVRLYYYANGNWKAVNYTYMQAP